MTVKTVHLTSGLAIAIFTGLHLYNHFCSVFGAAKHIQVMTALRPLYRSVFMEAILLIAVLVQIVSGLQLFRANRKTATAGFARLHVWTGMYLAAFLLIHVGAVLGARHALHLDTNFYFGVAGLNAFPFNLFFIPYYGLAVFSFFGHVASIHSKKMKRGILNMMPKHQAKAILLFGLLLTLAILYGLTNRLQGVEVPKEYRVLIGK